MAVCQDFVAIAMDNMVSGFYKFYEIILNLRDNM